MTLRSRRGAGAHRSPWVGLALTALAVLALGGAAGCSVKHRSSEFACQTQADCGSDRRCVDGFCVIAGDAALGDAAPGDAAPDAPRAIDAAVCPPGCTSCDAAQKTCTIDCALDSGACSQLVVCPAGWSCTIGCAGTNDCIHGIDCTSATSCTIGCGGQGSCKGVSCGAVSCKLQCTGAASCADFTCGTGPCNVNCTGNDACRNASCGSACACDLACTNPMACAGLALCRAFACVLPFPQRGCTSLPAGCNTCP